MKLSVIRNALATYQLKDRVSEQYGIGVIQGFINSFPTDSDPELNTQELYRLTIYLYPANMASIRVAILSPLWGDQVEHCMRALTILHTQLTTTSVINRCWEAIKGYKNSDLTQAAILISRLAEFYLDDELLETIRTTRHPLLVLTSVVDRLKALNLCSKETLQIFSETIGLDLRVASTHPSVYRDFQIVINTFLQIENRVPLTADVVHLILRHTGLFAAGASAYMLVGNETILDHTDTPINIAQKRALAQLRETLVKLARSSLLTQTAVDALMASRDYKTIGEMLHKLHENGIPQDYFRIYCSNAGREHPRIVAEIIIILAKKHFITPEALQEISAEECIDSMLEGFKMLEKANCLNQDSIDVMLRVNRHFVKDAEFVPSLILLVNAGISFNRADLFDIACRERFDQHDPANRYRNPINREEFKQVRHEKYKIPALLHKLNQLTPDNYMAVIGSNKPSLVESLHYLVASNDTRNKRYIDGLMDGNIDMKQVVTSMVQQSEKYRVFAGKPKAVAPEQTPMVGCDTQKNGI